MNEFRVPPVVLYGRDSFSQVGVHAARLGSKALIVSDRIMEKLDYVTRCKQMLDRAGVASVSYLDVNSEPTDQHVATALELFQKKTAICSSPSAEGVVWTLPKPFLSSR